MLVGSFSLGLFSPHSESSSRENDKCFQSQFERLIIYVHKEEVQTVCGELTSFSFCLLTFLHVIDISPLIDSRVKADGSVMSKMLDRLKPHGTSLKKREIFLSQTYLMYSFK